MKIQNSNLNNIILGETVVNLTIKHIHVYLVIYNSIISTNTTIKEYCSTDI